MTTTNSPAPPRPQNASLWLGALLVGAAVILAVIGPAIAPHDPFQPSYITEINGEMVRPPYPVFATAEFPLGADRAGRDTLSQLLYAIRPTLALTAAAALLRVALGLLLGLLAGWLPGSRTARAAGRAINLAGVLPVLLVALVIVALAGAFPSAGVFLLALTLTGWAEVARLTREETRVIRSQPFIEAARATGLSDGQIIARHVLRQLAPMLLIAFIAEVGAALLAISALGFLGYYIGGTAWLMISDFAVGRAGGAAPELGQLIGYAAQRLDSSPSLMLMAGATIFWIVLGFNFLAAGLREQFALENARRNRIYARVSDFVSSQVDERMRQMLKQARRKKRAVAISLAILGMGLVTLSAYAQRLANTGAAIPPAPGGHAWASSLRDSQAGLQTDSAGIAQPELRWTFAYTGAFSGGPVISRDGVIYLAGEQDLLALGLDGALLWQTPLSFHPTGTPALAANGNIFVMDNAGGLHTFLPAGVALRAFAPEQKLSPLAAPGGGPITAKDGSVFYAVDGYVIALGPDGAFKWRGQIPYSSFGPSLRLSTDETTLFFADTALDARTGRVLFPSTPAGFDQFSMAPDGRTFLFSDSEMLEWKTVNGGITLGSVGKMDWVRRFPSSAAAFSGFTNRKIMWLLLTNEFQDTRIVWLSERGQFVSSVNFDQRQSLPAGIDRDGTMIVCGLSRSLGPECVAAQSASETLRWRFSLPAERAPRGGALFNGILYVATTDGKLIAIGEK